MAVSLFAFSQMHTNPNNHHDVVMATFLTERTLVMLQQSARMRKRVCKSCNDIGIAKEIDQYNNVVSKAIAIVKLDVCTCGL